MGSLFKILMDASNDAFALSKVVVGTVINGTINGIAAFAFKDSSGNAAMPQLNAEGAVLVSFDAGTTIRNSAVLLSGSQTLNTETMVAEIDLTVAKKYNKINAQVGCARYSEFRLAYVDDAGGTPAETDLGYAVVDAGSLNENIQLAIDELDTTGGTGDQKLRLYHKPFDKVSKAYGSVSANEIA